MFLFALIVFAILCLSQPLRAEKSYVALSSSPTIVSVQSMELAIAELFVTNVVTSDIELVQLSLYLHVFAQSVDDELVISIYNQDMVAVASKTVRATFAGQIQSVEMISIDNPGPGNHTYSIKCSGAGIVSYSNSISRFEAYVVASNSQPRSAAPPPYQLKLSPEASAAADLTRMPTQLPSATDVPSAAPVELPAYSRFAHEQNQHLDSASIHLNRNNPTAEPTVEPTAEPTAEPTVEPTVSPSCVPSTVPSLQPSFEPSQTPSCRPSLVPSGEPSHGPSKEPSQIPTKTPSYVPSYAPSYTPTLAPSRAPSPAPSQAPSPAPTRVPTSPPIAFPTFQNPPTPQPFAFPTFQSPPSPQPFVPPTNANPSRVPSVKPSAAPSEPRAVPIVSMQASRHSELPNSAIVVYVSLTKGFNAIVRCARVKSTEKVTSTSQIVDPGFNAVSSDSSAVVTITGLTPQTSYRVYCLTESDRGLLLSLNALTEQNVAVQTLCCKTVSVQLSTRTVYVSSYTPELVSLTLSHRPRGSVTVLLSTSPTGWGTFTPSSFGFTNASSMTATAHFTAGREATQELVVRATITGLESEEFSTRYPSGSTMTLLSASSPLPQPMAFPTFVSPPSPTPFVPPTNVNPSRTPSAKPSAAPSEARAVPIVSMQATRHTELPNSAIVVYVSLTKGFNAIVRCAAVKSSEKVTSTSQIVDPGFNAVSSDSSAVVTITGLTPQTSYRVYCLTESDRGLLLSLNALTEQNVAVQTLCCKTVSVQLSTRTVYVSSYTPELVSLTLSHRPRGSVTVLLSTSPTGWGTFTPSSFVFTNASSMTASAHFTAGREATQELVVRATITGLESEEFSARYPSGSTMTLLSASSPLPQPVAFPTFASPPSPTPFVPPSNGNPSRVPSAKPSAAPSEPRAVPIVSMQAARHTELPNSAIVVYVSLTKGFNAIVRCAAVKSSEKVTSSSQIVDPGFNAVSSDSSAVVTITGLTPQTSYRVYCLTESDRGLLLSMNSIAEQNVAVQTACCKTVSLQLSSQTVYVNSYTPELVSLTLSHRPRASVTVLLSTSPTSRGTFYPSSIVFTNASSMTASAHFVAGTVATQELVVRATFTGLEAEEFTSRYPSGSTMTLLDASVPPPTPRLLSATFSGDGSSVIVLFTSPTNKGGYTNGFTCVSLLSFDGSSAAKCQWRNASAIVVYPDATRTPILAVNSALRVQERNTIRASCHAQAKGCSLWATVSPTSVELAAPTNRLKPELVLVVPGRIARCASLLVDLSTSSGAGGRPWQVPTFTVDATEGNATAVADFLRENYTLSSAIVVPNDRLANVSGSLVITVRLCNFLGACSSATATVTIDPSTAPILIVSIPGPSVRSASSSAGLLLTSSAYTLSCNGTQSSRNLRYAWSVLDNGVAVSPEVLRSDSADVSKFRVSPYQLKALHYYTFLLTVTSTLTGTVTTASVGVNVLQSTLVAQVTGGVAQTIRVDSTLLLDASLSFDPDVSTLSSQLPLMYRWTCLQTAPTFVPSCPFNLVSGSLQAAQLELSALNRSVGVIAQLTVTVSDSTRSSTSAVQLTTVAANAPVVRIMSLPDALTSVNINRKVSVSGLISTQGACLAQWSVDQTSLLLESIALSPVSSQIEAGAARAVALVLAANALPSRAALSFTLSCGQSSAAIQLTTNGPPLPGLFQISPNTGTELSTMYSLRASLWRDEDLPLSYQFGFVSSTSGNNLVLIGKTQTAHGTTLLTAGPDIDAYKVTCYATIYDQFDANTTVYTDATVKPQEDALASITQFLLESEGVDATRNAMNLGSGALNAVNCSNAPDCTSLNRQSCRRVMHTCGPCLSNYLGEAGDVNSRCIYSVGDKVNGDFRGRQRRLTAQSCKSDRDCGTGWDVCDKLTNPLNPVCAVPQKQCTNDCSDRGKCLMININSGDSVVDCLVSDASCVAQCQCNEGYGGRDCSLTTEYLQGRQSLRATFMQALATILQYDDVNIATVSSWSDGLSALTQDPYEMSAESASEVSALAQQILATASTVSGFSYESAVGVLDSLSAATASTGYTNSSSVSASLATIARFNDLVAAQSVAGQDSVGYYYDNFQLKSVKQFATAGNTIDLATPTGALQTSATASKVQVSPDADDELTVSLISTPAASYGDLGKSFNTNPLQLSVTRTAASSTHAIFVLTHNAPVEFKSEQVTEAMRFSTNCSGLNDRPLVSSYTCPGSGEVIEHNCTGLSAGTLTSYCPVLVPSCAVLNVTATSVDLNSNSSVCVVAAYDAYSTTCNCTLTSDTVTLRRRLDEISTSGVLSVVAASFYVGSEFVDTFNSYDEFTSAESLRRVLIVIIMFSTLWAAGFVLILTCTGRRKYMEPQHKKTLEEIKEKLQSVQKTKTREDVRRYLTDYVMETFPSVFSNKPFFGRMYGEIKRHHRYLTLLTATKGPTGDKDRILTAVDLLSTQTMLMFLLALLYDVQAPTNDGKCVTYLDKGNCLQRRSPFDDDQTYCIWQTPGNDPANHFCEYQNPRFSLQIVIYIAVIVALITAIFQAPLDYCMDLLSAPLADDLKIAEEETVLHNVGRHITDVARKVSVVAGNVANAAQRKLSSTRKSLVGTLSRKIPESTEVAHSLASVSMQLIRDSSQQSLRERELNQMRKFHQSGGSYKSHSRANDDDSSSDSSSDDESDEEAFENEAATGDIEAVHPERRSTKRSSRLSKAATVEPDEAGANEETLATPGASSSKKNANVDSLMLRLIAEISCQRRLLVEDDRDFFDSQWGLDTTGEFCQGEHSRLPFLFKGKPGAQQLIRGELEFVKSETAKKCDKLRVATDQHTGLEILHLFIMDLLGRRTPAARIFETKAMEDFKHTKVVSKNAKILAIAGLVLINVFFMYYSMLTGFRRGLSWQRMYLIACMIQLAVEITLFETMECVWINCCVPILVSAEVRRVGDSIIEVVQHMCSDEKHIDTSLFLNAPDYLFVSTNVAKKFPALMESIVVQTYTNHVPGELAKIWQVGSVSRINPHRHIREATLLASILAVLQVMGTAPFVIHRMFVRFSQPFAFSALVIFWRLIVSNPIYLSVALVLTFLFGCYCAYMYYLDRYRTRKAQSVVAPATAEYMMQNPRTRAVVFVGKPNPLDIPPKVKSTKMKHVNGQNSGDDRIDKSLDEVTDIGHANEHSVPIGASFSTTRLIPSDEIHERQSEKFDLTSDFSEDDGPLHMPSPKARPRKTLKGADSINSLSSEELPDHLPHNNTTKVHNKSTRSPNDKKETVARRKRRKSSIHEVSDSSADTSDSDGDSHYLAQPRTIHNDNKPSSTIKHIMSSKAEAKSSPIGNNTQISSKFGANTPIGSKKSIFGNDTASKKTFFAMHLNAASSSSGSSGEDDDLSVTSL